MDIRLAGKMDGIEAARRIWERLQIPAVYVTAHADLQTLAGVKTTENYGYLVKPFQTSSVRAAVELALYRRQKETRLSGEADGAEPRAKPAWIRETAARRKRRDRS
jgi:DNA-binding NtrC family response regulator